MALPLHTAYSVFMLCVHGPVHLGNLDHTQTLNSVVASVSEVWCLDAQKSDSSFFSQMTVKGSSKAVEFKYCDV